MKGVRDITAEFLSVTASEGVILCAAFCGDGKAGWNRHPKKAHLGKVCAFPSEQFLHLPVTFG